MFEMEHYFVGDIVYVFCPGTLCFEKHQIKSEPFQFKNEPCYWTDKLHGKWPLRKSLITGRFKRKKEKNENSR